MYTKVVPQGLLLYIGYSITLPTVFLLWALFIDVRLFYGNFNINKLSVQTLRYAYAALAFFLAYNIVAACYIALNPDLLSFD